MAAAALLRSHDTSALAPGIAYTSKKVLPYAVILLGFGLNLAQIAQVGATSLPIIVSTITTSLVIAFVLASVVTTVFALPANVTAPLKELSKFLIVMAMAAIGLNTDLVKLVRTGGKPILMGFCCWVGISPYRDS